MRYSLFRTKKCFKDQPTIKCYGVTNSTGATSYDFCQSQDEFRIKEQEFVHFRTSKCDWELMRKATWKCIATLPFTGKHCSFSSPKRQVNIFWMAAQRFGTNRLKQQIYLWAKCGPRMLKTNPTQICLPNRGLEKFLPQIHLPKTRGPGILKTY